MKEKMSRKNRGVRTKLEKNLEKNPESIKIDGMPEPAGVYVRGLMAFTLDTNFSSDDSTVGMVEIIAEHSFNPSPGSEDGRLGIENGVTRIHQIIKILSCINSQPSRDIGREVIDQFLLYSVT